MRKTGVLCDTDGHLLDQSKGVILVTCADGDRFYDIFSEQVKMNGGRDPRIHTFGWNGGALRIARNSPTNEPGHTTDVDCLRDVLDAMAMKDITTVALYVHAPCGKAAAHDLSFESVITLLIGAKRRIKEAAREACVACFCHVHYPDGRNRSYFVSREAWEKWQSEE